MVDEGAVLDEDLRPVWMAEEEVAVAGAVIVEGMDNGEGSGFSIEALRLALALALVRDSVPKARVPESRPVVLVPAL